MITAAAIPSRVLFRRLVDDELSADRQEHDAEGRPDHAILVAVAPPVYVTLFVFRVTPSHVSAHECLGDCAVYVGRVTVPRRRLPRVRAGDRVRLRVA
jgi:hypothetical protein